jgi:hypothetical protein
MTEQDKLDRIRLIYKRRAREFYDSFGMKWDRRAWHEFLTRVSNAHASGEGVDDMDLKVLVRLYNRELKGKDNGS